MKRHKFVTPLIKRDGVWVIEDPVVVHQMYAVLHLSAGEECVIGDGSGMDTLVSLVAVEKKKVVCDVVGTLENTNDPQIAVTLCCAILKSDHFVDVVQKATEIGVRTIVPLITARTIKKDVNMTRLQTIIREAAEQSNRGILPILEIPVLFKNVFSQHPSPFVFLTQGGEEKSIVGGAAQLTLFVGPEGGWTDEEIAMAKERGALMRSLGKLVLRAETAAITGSYLGCHGLL
jgi:16S rRNA (uracil1498-N3)-methyltransferase